MLVHFLMYSYIVYIIINNYYMQVRHDIETIMLNIIIQKLVFLFVAIW